MSNFWNETNTKLNKYNNIQKIQINYESVEFDFNSNQHEKSRNASNYSSQVILPIQMAESVDNGSRETKSDYINKINLTSSKVSPNKQKLSKTQIQIRNHLIKRKYNKYYLTHKSSIKIHCWDDLGNLT